LISNKGVRSGYFVNSENGSINSINLPQCYFYFYDDHPEKSDRLSGTLILPIRIAFLPFKTKDKEWGTMESVGVNFKSNSNYPEKDMTVILKNLSFGKNLNSDASVYSIRKYNTFEGSERINIARGRTHSNKFFIVKAGNNSINYEIINNQNNLLLEKGDFNLYVNAYRYKGCTDEGEILR